MASFLLWFFAGILALVPALFWIAFWYRKGSPLKPASKRLVVRSFFFGAVGILPLLAIKYMLPESPNLMFVWEFIQARSFFFSVVILTVVLAGLEEFLKHFSLFGRKEIHPDNPERIRNGIIYFISAGLGFAFLENALYFRDALLIVGIHAAFWRIFLFRSFGTMLGHALFSGVFGLFWIYAALTHKKVSHTPHVLAVRWEKFLQRIFDHAATGHVTQKTAGIRKYFRWHVFFEALFVATAIHAVFNLLVSSKSFGLNLLFLIPPFLVFIFWFVSSHMSGKQQKH